MAASMLSMKVYDLTRLKHYLKRLLDKGLINKTDKGCLLEVGWTRKKYPNPKTITYNTTLDNKRVRTQIRLHALAFFLEKGELAVPGSTDISHLCNIRGCINVKHMVLEAHRYNCLRRRCFSNFKKENKRQTNKNALICDCEGGKLSTPCLNMN